MSDDTRAGEKALYFILGAAMGAVTALLFAPQSGEETRRMIASRAREGADYLSTKTRDVTEKTSGIIDRGKEVLQQQRDQLTAAFEAGKQAYKDEKEKAKT
jgi:gas vesicle protein